MIMNNKQIVYINIDKIHPHPHNPRKDLGDLTELADSIKVSGILQNLTIVPLPGGPSDEYYAVIGHRRHGAARIAGLQQVPCVISEMDEKEQIRIMMVENINRSALTIIEEAAGFQMMLNFGDSIAEIAQKTGFSQSTVHRRVKLLELDRDKFQESFERGATLQDYMMLDKIKDIELKNKVLDTIGTPNFKYELKHAQDQEKEAEKKSALIAELNTFATQIEQTDTNGLKHIKWYSFYGKVDFEKPADAGHRKYFFTDSTYNITLYAEPTAQDKAEDMAREELQQKLSAREAQLDQIAERAYQLRHDFVIGLNSLKKKVPLLTKMAVQSMLLNGWQYKFNESMFLEGIGLTSDAHGASDIRLLNEPLEANPEKVLFMAAYSKLGDSIRNKCHGHAGSYHPNEQLSLVYNYLIPLGYELSDEEQSYWDGTHILFQRDDTEDAA